MTESQTESSSVATRLWRVPARIRSRLWNTLLVARGVFRRRRSSGIMSVVTVLYLGVFLWMLNDILITPAAGFSVFVVDSVLETMLKPAPGAFLYRPVALLELGVVTWEFSPLNTLLGFGIAFLVGLNLAFSYLATTQPRSCGMSAGAGLFASIPALLAGSTCCAPVILLVLGIQASGIILTVYVWFLPLSIALLLATLIYVAGKVDPTAM